MNQIAHCDWIPKWARWSCLAHLGPTRYIQQEKFPESHITNAVLTKLVQSRWLDIGLILCLQVYGP